MKRRILPAIRRRSRRCARPPVPPQFRRRAKPAHPLRRAQPLPQRLHLGHRDRRLSGRRRRSRRRPRSLRLGYLLPHSWQNLSGPDRRCRRRLLSPLPAGHRADAASRHEGLPLLHRMAAHLPATEPARPTPKASTSTSASSTLSWPPTSSPSAPSSTGIYPRHSRTKAAGPAAPPLRPSLTTPTTPSASFPTASATG